MYMNQEKVSGGGGGYVGAGFKTNFSNGSPVADELLVHMHSYHAVSATASVPVADC